ncbi:C39 family peptidase [Bacillus sp. FJAT-50079]|uniref:C39 family peptidase n=1 Tax=Bacillus sp. FJAT-50079 TaxID=2833577 RepID=UPI001BCA5243|nr:C39 family peptidase [Bacillus sp. FJAT-50079]MBS4208596.1 C39 family peptidase [Bacillus sp. FJAT-50079]
MNALLVVLIASVLGLLILCFIKHKRQPLLSTILSLIVMIAFCLFVIYIGEGHGEASEAEAVKATPIQLEKATLIKIEESVLIDAPHIQQLPELPRGCEVTSLAMLLRSAGVQADKMTLAKEVKKDPTDRTIVNGQIHFGNPHKGFVGNMYTFNEPGFGVYHKPIMELAESYLPGRIVNLSNQSFEELKIPLSDGRPVWVIINSHYKKLDDSFFETWHTADGEIQITMKEHSVLITGYDEHFVYFNDPLNLQTKAPIEDFKQSWVQMGSHALTYSYED